MFTTAARAQDANVRPPFVATPEEAVERMLALAEVRADDFVVDLGSGDGRIVIMAARQFGARGLGVDIDPGMVARSRENARHAGVDSLVRFEERDVLKTGLSGASVVTIYLLPSLVDQLQPKLLDELKPGARIVAHAFPMKGWKPDRRESLRIAEPRGGQSGESELFLWVVPVEARGTWRAQGGWELRVQQNFQEIDVTVTHDGQPMGVQHARLNGRQIDISGLGYAIRGRIDGAVLSGDIVRDGRAAPATFTLQEGSRGLFRGS